MLRALVLLLLLPRDPYAEECAMILLLLLSDFIVRPIPKRRTRSGRGVPRSKLLFSIFPPPGQASSIPADRGPRHGQGTIMVSRIHESKTRLMVVIKKALGNRHSSSSSSGTRMEDADDGMFWIGKPSLASTTRPGQRRPKRGAGGFQEESVLEWRFSTFFCWVQLGDEWRVSRS